MIPQLLPAQVAAALQSDDPPVLLDVREAEELALVSLPEVVHIPLGELSRRWRELDSDESIVCVCHHGIRSARAAIFLHSQGFERVSNLRGGVDAWSLQLDPSLPRY